MARGFPDLRDAIVEIMGEERVFPDEHKKDDADDNIAVTIPAIPRSLDELIGDDIDDPDADDIPAYDASKPLRIAIVGRPNAGKSTLVNTMLGEDRLLTGPEAGITRNSISVDWEWNGRKIKLFDTAGLRRKSRVQGKLEKLSVGDALRAIRFAEVVIIVLDATIPFEKQDLQIADLIIREGRAPVIAFNKWDLVENRQMVLADLREKTERLLPQIRGIRAVPISGERNQGIDKLMAAVASTDEDLKSPHFDRPSSITPWRRSCASSTARCRRPAPQDQVHHAGQDASAGLRHFVLASRCVPDILCTLSRQRDSRDVRYSGCSYPPCAPHLGQSLRRTGKEEAVGRRPYLSPCGGESDFSILSPSLKC